MRSLIRAMSLATLALALATGCSMMGGSKGPVTGVYEENQVTRTATVQKIDMAKRLVTLKGDQSGDTVVVKASDAVRNLPQLKVGDKVHATYYQSIAYEVHKPGTLTDTETQAAAGLATAEAGQKPGAMAAEIVRVVATIVSIDKQTPSVTLRTESGDVLAVKVKHPEKLDQIKVGDVAEIFLSQAVAITAEPASN
jgi:hypothetical protein